MDAIPVPTDAALPPPLNSRHTALTWFRAKAKHQYQCQCELSPPGWVLISFLPSIYVGSPRGGTLSPTFPWACPRWQLPLHPSYSCASLGHLHSDTVPWGLNARAGGSSWNPGPALPTPGDLEQFIQLLGAPGSSCLQAKGMEPCLNLSGHSIHCSHLYMVLPAP